MSDRPIQVGDLVQIVRWPCCGEFLGVVFVVGEIFRHKSHPQCTACKQTIHEATLCLEGNSAPNKDKLCAPKPWLKRIPPLEELEGQKSQEDMKEPA